MAIESIIALAGGLAEGKGEGRKQKMADELHMAQTNLIKQESKAKEAALVIDNLKAKLLGQMSPEHQLAVMFPKADDTLEAKLATIQKFMGQQGGTAPAAPPAPFGGGTEMFPLDPSVTQSLPQQIAAGQMGGIAGMTQEDLVRGVLKKELGAEPTTYHRTATVAGPDGNPWVVPMDMMGNLDMSKARPAPVKADMQSGVGPGMAPIQTPMNPYNRQPMGAPIQTGPPPTMQVETPTPGGGKVKGVVPLFPGGSKVSGTAGGVRTELDLLDVPIPATDITKWSDGQGGNPPMGWTPRQAQARGFKQTQEGMPAESGGKAVMVAQAVQDIQAVRQLFFPKPGVFNRNLAISAQMGLPEWMSKGSQTAVSMSMNAAAAKLRLETGATARPEEQKDIINRFIPTWKDTYESASNKIDRFESFMTAGQFILDPKGRIVIVEPTGKKGKPDLSLGKKKGGPKTWQDYKKQAGAQ